MQVDELLELIGLNEQDKRIVNAMIAGEWDCLNCQFVGTCDAIKLANEQDELINPCRGWQSREKGGECDE